MVESEEEESLISKLRIDQTGKRFGRLIIIEQEKSMSRYCKVQTEFRDSAALIDALAETGNWEIDQIELHKTSQHLVGYRGDKRQEKAHIIIRRKFIGSSSNDIGFVIGEDGNYEAIISEFDSSKYGKSWNGKLKGNYAFHKVRRDMESRGRSVTRERCPGGRQRVIVTGYR